MVPVLLQLQETTKLPPTGREEKNADDGPRQKQQLSPKRRRGNIESPFR